MNDVDCQFSIKIDFLQVHAQKCFASSQSTKKVFQRFLVLWFCFCIECTDLRFRHLFHVILYTLPRRILSTGTLLFRSPILILINTSTMRLVCPDLDRFLRVLYFSVLCTLIGTHSVVCTLVDNKLFEIFMIPLWHDTNLSCLYCHFDRTCWICSLVNVCTGTKSTGIAFTVMWCSTILPLVPCGMLYTLIGCSAVANLPLIHNYISVRAKPDTLGALRILYLFVTWPVASSYEKPLVMTCSKQFMMLPFFFFFFFFLRMWGECASWKSNVWKLH